MCDYLQEESHSFFERFYLLTESLAVFKHLSWVFGIMQVYLFEDQANISAAHITQKDCGKLFNTRCMLLIIRGALSCLIYFRGY